MKLLKSALIICSALGIAHAAKKYKNAIVHKKRIAKRVGVTAVRNDERRVIINDTVNAESHRINQYNQLTPEEVRQEFKQRIAAGNWLSEEEYIALMNGMKIKENRCMLNKETGL